MFGTGELHAAVQKALAEASVPAESRGAFVLVATTDGGVSGVLSAKVGDVWEVSGVIAVDHAHGIAAGASVKAVW